MKKFIIVFLVLITGVIVGAGLAHFLSAWPIFGGEAKNELSQEEAKSILSQNPPGKLFRSIYKQSQAKSPDPLQKITLEKMQEKGYITLKKVRGEYEVTITSKLTPFVVSEDGTMITFKLADIVVDKITDITMKGDELDVAYTTRLETNQLAEDVFAPVSNPTPGPNHAGFRLVDGKWR